MVLLPRRVSAIHVNFFSRKFVQYHKPKKYSTSTTWHPSVCKLVVLCCRSPGVHTSPTKRLDSIITVVIRIHRPNSAREKSCQCGWVERVALRFRTRGSSSIVPYIQSGKTKNCYFWGDWERMLVCKTASVRLNELGAGVGWKVFCIKARRWIWVVRFESFTTLVTIQEYSVHNIRFFVRDAHKMRFKMRYKMHNMIADATNRSLPQCQFFCVTWSDSAALHGACSGLDIVQC